MATKTKSRVRFQERAELLDFLLEVSAITSETLDLDRLLENVADIVRRVIPHELFAILLYNERRRRSEFATPSATAKRWSIICSSLSERASRAWPRASAARL